MRKLLVSSAIALSACLGLAACNNTSPPPNTDPKKGTVTEQDGYVDKYCDGTTLVYEVGRGGSTIPNSPECK